MEGDGNRRGPYFRYLRNDELPIPNSTARDRQQDINHINQEADVNIETVYAMDIDSNGQNEELASNGEEIHANVFHTNNDDEQEMEANYVEPENEIRNDSEDEFDAAYIEPDAANAVAAFVENIDEEQEPQIINQEKNNDERVPLYPGCPLTSEESYNLIMGYVIRHTITDYALQDLLELINCFIPTTALPSMYHFLKRFPISNMTSYYYCPDCLILIDFTNNDSVSTCLSCNTSFSMNSLKRNGHFFLHIPLKEQLIALLSSPTFHELNRSNEEDDKISDVTSGTFYQKLRRNGTVSNHDITIQFNADGVQTFKSSRVSMCPLQVQINELPYNRRKQNILLTGLWASSERPVLDLFLQPFVDELKDLHENGIECTPPGFEETIIVKVHTILSSVDSVERCSLQNMHQFNGQFGCTYCVHPGERVPIGDGFSRVYSAETSYPNRTKDQHRSDALKAVSDKAVVNGVKGVALTMLLPVFNFIKCFPPEYMHCVLLGVVRLFLSTWLDSKYNDKSFYIGTKSEALNSRLSLILPPSEVTRTPQSVSDVCRWKASELKNFLLYYSLPTLKGLLSSVFYTHWTLLVYAITIFDSDKISNQAFHEATRAIIKFVHQTEILYGKEMMKFNVHLLLHIPQNVRRFGALWAWSAFPYEGNNLVLRSMLHNSQSILQQICKSYLRFQKIKYCDTFDRNDCNDDGKKFFKKMLDKYRKMNGRRLINNNHLVIYGQGKIIMLTLTEKILIEAFLGQSVLENAVIYERFVYRNILYHGSTYNRMYKRNNSVVETSLNTFMAISGLVHVTLVNGRNCYIVLGKLFEILHEDLCNSDNISTSDFCKSVSPTDNITACLPENLTSKCILMTFENKSYISRLVNKVEFD